MCCFSTLQGKDFIVIYSREFCRRVVTYIRLPILSLVTVVTAVCMHLVGVLQGKHCFCTNLPAFVLAYNLFTSVLNS